MDEVTGQRMFTTQVFAISNKLLIIPKLEHYQCNNL